MSNPNLQLPELLLPAGDLDKAYTAFRYGADAIYCGVAMFSLRTRENLFTEENITEIIEYARENGKKVYVTLNAFPHEFMMKLYEKHLKFLEQVKPDGIIFADLGVLALANEFAPSVAKHLSVQTSTMNLPAIKQWQALGVERIICAREMAIKEVAKLHAQIPEMELEYFVHGAVCMAYSGRCLLSNFTGGRDANRGACNHTCRWNYRVVDDENREVDVSDHYEGVEVSPPMLREEALPSLLNQEGGNNECGSKSIRDFETNEVIEEETRQGQMVPVEEDFHGTHIMSSRDMCMIESMKEIQDAGVCSLKVEGRHKTAYYAATVARTYRQALDDVAAGKAFNPKLWDEIHATANRGFFPGFLNGKPQSGDIQYEENRSTSPREVCARVLGYEDGKIIIDVKNKITAGSELEVVMPRMSDDFVFNAEQLTFGEDTVEILHGGNTNQTATISCKKAVPVGVFLRQKTQNPGVMPKLKVLK